jgi:peptide/nickel transport system ATP-binding protein
VNSGPTVADEPTLAVEHLDVVFAARRRQPAVHAVRDVSFTIARGETLGLVGESGSGKSTTARGMMRLVEPAGGRVVLGGQDITALGRREMRRARRDMQMVFQDPYSSLDPSRVIGLSVGESLEVHTRLGAPERHEQVRELLRRVNLSPDLYERYPYEFSGGQRQRIAIARAIALRPRVVVCDEAVSSLDVSTQNEIINLLEELQADLGMSYLFIAHDLAVVRHISDRIAVMYLGHIVEEGPSERVFNEPAHPYTEMLLAAVPSPDPSRRGSNAALVHGELPDPARPPAGCPFRSRCRYALDECATTMPASSAVRGGGTVRCHAAPIRPRRPPSLASSTTRLLTDTVPTLP